MAATLSDVAQRVGLAPSSVADILRGRPGYAEATRRRTLEAARELCFVPNFMARSLQRQQSHTIGIVGQLSNTVVSGPMLKAIVDGLSQAGYMPLFCDASLQSPQEPHGERQARAVHELRSRSVDGMILNFNADDETLRRIMPPDAPCVPIVSVATQTPSVVIDTQAALEQGVAWLAARGHRRIAFMGVDNAAAQRKASNSHALKIKGFLTGMERLGLDGASLLFDCDPSAGQVRQFVAARRHLFESITAVLACNDRVAVEVISGLSGLGLRVPEDISVVGYDDTEFARATRPALTTFRPRYDEVGGHAVRLLLDLIAGRSVERVTVVPELVERESARAVAIGDG